MGPIVGRIGVLAVVVISVTVAVFVVGLVVGPAVVPVVVPIVVSDVMTPVVAIVVPDPTQGPALDPDAMMAQIRDKIARFKQPKAIVLREALPRNTMGKVQKAALRAELGALFTQT